MLDPFRLFARLLIASFRIAGYFITCVVQAAWYVIHGRADRIGDAIGSLGRGITDSVADVFQR